MVAGTFVVKHELAGVAVVIVQEVAAAFKVICAAPAVGMVSVALNRTRVAILPDRFVIVKSIFGVLPTTTCAALNDLLNIKLLLPAATTTNVSVAVGPAIGVCVLVTPPVVFMYDAAVPDCTGTVIRQDEFAGIEPPVSVTTEVASVAVSVLPTPQLFVGAGAAALTRLIDG